VRTAHKDRKKEIMRAVEKLAVGQRLYEITLDDVVKEAKIGKGTIYHYFRNKEELFFEVATNGFDELCELLRQEVCNNASFNIKFSYMCNHIIRFFAGRQQLLQIMQTHAAHIYWSKSSFRERWFSKRRALVSTVSDILSAGVAEGAIRSDLSTDFLATSLLAVLRAYVRDSDTYSDSTREVELLVDLFLNGACKADSAVPACRGYTKAI
jgi:AcrR family transcriptional regulator